ncbi:transposase [Arsenophonus endosymbiont of Bemisia tabaci]|uniref:transposase n=1 Tax=Arsenophonus endosymbiont of Bemisia tabaci TaxID=536059 RepID=UPI003B847452
MKNSTSSESRRKHSTNVSTKKQQYEKEGKHIVFIDESGFSHDTPRTHGYSPKGQRCVGLKNWGAKGRTNVIGALLGTTLFAIGLFDININSDVFYAWVTPSPYPSSSSKQCNHDG